MLATEKPFRDRFWQPEKPRPGDDRDEYQRDKARIIHSAGFRRLQAKTQVMGVGEGDFHRTRLTHSLEAGQIGEGILSSLKRRFIQRGSEWLPSADLVLAACYAHDLGHPPFGHGGEKALHLRMVERGGFEGNAQTLRILTRLEKYWHHQGINPTRRLVLAVLKYPVPFSTFSPKSYQRWPPKCYYDSEQPIVEWALEPFAGRERKLFTTEMDDGKPKHRSLDSSLMECADDIAYGVHDLEDIVARHFVHERELISELEKLLREPSIATLVAKRKAGISEFRAAFFGAGGSPDRKRFIGHLVNLFVGSAEVREEKQFQHPLLRFRVALPGAVGSFLTALKKLTFRLVIERAEVQQLESRGQRLISGLFKRLSGAPEQLIPRDAWMSLDPKDTDARRVCDYIAGMTDRYAERIYQRLFIPGFGSSRDEL